MTATDRRTDPPPLHKPIVDDSGFPTQEMRGWMHRLWERTGGTDSGDDFLMKMLQSTARPHVQQKIEEAAQEYDPSIPDSQAKVQIEQLCSMLSLLFSDKRSEIPTDSMIAMLLANRQSPAPVDQLSALVAALSRTPVQQVTQTINNTVDGMEIGDIWPSARSAHPRGLICDGASYDTTTYASLFAEIGYAFGGSGSNFNVPDLRDTVAVGIPAGGAMADALGANSQDLSHSHAKGSLATDGAGGHDHAVSGNTGNAGSHDHGVSLSTDSAGAHGHGLTAAGTDSAADHSHGDGTLATDNAPGHSHGDGTLATDTAAAHNHDSGTLATDSAGAHDHGGSTGTTGSVNAGLLGSVPAAPPNHSHSISSDGAHSHGVTGNTGDAGGHAHDVTGSTDSAGGHGHDVTGATGDAGGHNHGLTGNTDSAGAHTHGVSGNTDNEADHAHSVSLNTDSEADHSHTVTGSTASALGATDMRQTSLALNYFIRYQ